MVSAYEGGKALPSLPSLWAYLGAIGRDLADLQDAIYELGGLPKRRSEDVEARERFVGRAVLTVLRGLEGMEELGLRVVDPARNADQLAYPEAADPKHATVRPKLTGG